MSAAPADLESAALAEVAHLHSREFLLDTALPGGRMLDLAARDYYVKLAARAYAATDEAAAVARLAQQVTAYASSETEATQWLLRSSGVTDAMQPLGWRTVGPLSAEQRRAHEHIVRNAFGATTLRSLRGPSQAVVPILYNAARQSLGVLSAVEDDLFLRDVLTDVDQTFPDVCEAVSVVVRRYSEPEPQDAYQRFAEQYRAPESPDYSPGRFRSPQ